MNLHARGVGLRLLHGVFGLAPPDLQDLEIGVRRQPLEIVRGLELLQLGTGLFERLLVLLGLDFRDHRVLDHLEIGPAERALRQLDLAVVLGAGGAPLRFLLPDLLLEIAQLGPPVERVLQLILAIELDEQVARPDPRARAHQFHDDERVRGRPRQPRGGDGGRLDGFNGPAEPDEPHEVPADDRDGPVPAPARLGLGPRVPRRQEDRGAAKNDDGGCAGKEITALHWRDHNLLLDTTRRRTDMSASKTCWKGRWLADSPPRQALVAPTFRSAPGRPA